MNASITKNKNQNFDQDKAFPHILMSPTIIVMLLLTVYPLLSVSEGWYSCCSLCSDIPLIESLLNIILVTSALCAILASEGNSCLIPSQKKEKPAAWILLPECSVLCADCILLITRQSCRIRHFAIP